MAINLFILNADENFLYIEESHKNIDFCLEAFLQYSQIAIQLIALSFKVEY
jgi:hypothetical protein